MKKFILKLSVYGLLILLVLELFVRLFHLYTEDPPRYIDDFGVEKRVPGHTGIAVTGNRNQNFSRFSINASGFNSKHEFNPKPDRFEIALIGDSFIEGFHQDFDRSLGTKIEKKLPGVWVYEYGYAGYDMANQLHLISAYPEVFRAVDQIVIYLDYSTDLERSAYQPNHGRIKTLNSTLFKVRDHIKLLSYASKIGVLDPVINLLTRKKEREDPERTGLVEKDARRLENFKELIGRYGWDESKYVLLLDKTATGDQFLAFCREAEIAVIDFSGAFAESAKSPILIYDFHWNDHGRELIAGLIAQYIRQLPENPLKDLPDPKN